MSFEEKGTWLYGVLLIAMPALYLATVLGQVAAVPVTEIEYQSALIAAIVGTIILSIIGMIVIGISSPREAGQAGQRDKDINRLGEYVGGIVLAVGMVVPFGLAMLEVPYFWIANAMFLTFVVAGLCGTIVKLVLYRRGF